MRRIAHSPEMERSGRLMASELGCLTMLWMLCHGRCSSASGWLMGNWSFTYLALPGNTTHCVQLPFANTSMPFHTHRCVGIRFWEQFSFAGSHFVMSTSTGNGACLDDVVDGSTRVGLRDGDAVSQSQRWRSSLMAPYASNGPLIVGELQDFATSDWTFLESSYLADSKPILLPSSRSSNLVLNDRFLEKWGSQADSSGHTTLLCRWTILGHSTTAFARNSNWSGDWYVILGAISQTVPTHPGLPHTLKFNLKVKGTCGGQGGDPAADKVLVSLLPSSSEFNMVDIDSNGGLWKAEELGFLAVTNTVHLTFATVSGNSSCSVVIGNVEAGLEDDYLISEAANRIGTRLLCLYALVAFLGILALVVLVAYVVGSLRTRKLK